MKLDAEGGEYLILKRMLEMFQSPKISRLLIEITDEMSKAALLNQGMNNNLAPIQKLVWV